MSSAPQGDDEEQQPGNERDDETPDPEVPGSGIPGFSIPGFDLSGIDLSGFDLSGIDFAGMARALHSPGPLNWEVARQVADLVATGNEAEPAIDAAAETQLAELARAAQTHVVAETGLAATFAAPVRVSDRKQWNTLHLDALRPVLERMASTLGGAFQADAVIADLPDPTLDPTGAPSLEQLMSVLPLLAPVLLGAQAGTMIGYLSQHALGRYDLPLPVAGEPSLTFVVRNLDEFEADWSLERADLRFYVAIHEVVHAAVRSVSWVPARMVELATDYVSGYVVDPMILRARLGDLDPTDPSALQALAADPDELLSAMRSDQQVALLERIRVLHSVLEGYADDVLERVGRPLIPSFDRIHEAIARHRIERGEAERFVGGLLGLATARDDYERGAAFCAGVVERAGTDGLNRLWQGVEMVPTPNEIDAPGLWLARIDLDLDG